jgi:hypothetical protein
LPHFLSFILPPSPVLPPLPIFPRQTFPVGARLPPRGNFLDFFAEKSSYFGRFKNYREIGLPAAPDRK